jgi:hypothetical protein
MLSQSLCIRLLGSRSEPTDRHTFIFHLAGANWLTLSIDSRNVESEIFIRCPDTADDRPGRPISTRRSPSAPSLASNPERRTLPFPSSPARSSLFQTHGVESTCSCAGEHESCQAISVYERKGGLSATIGAHPELPQLSPLMARRRHTCAAILESIPQLIHDSIS